MWLTRWFRGISYSGYDRHGNAKYLISRDADPTQCQVDGIPPEIRDEALALLCESFDIPEKQMYCLRPDDELLAIYQSFVGPRWWDDLEFERLGMAIDQLPGSPLSAQQAEGITTVQDVVCVVAARRGITTRCLNQWGLPSGPDH